jgi:quinate/shikimate dehydrogenase
LKGSVFVEGRIDGRTVLYGLIGQPVGHSGSPTMYNYSFKKCGINAAYLAFEVPVDAVGDAMAALRTFKMGGMNVTMPDKTEVLRYMDDLSPAARLAGACNTIVNKDGRLTGHMTDGEGFVRNLLDHGVDIAGKRLVILGAGGAATAIQVQCALDGAAAVDIFNVKDIFYDRAQKTVARLKKAAPACAVTLNDLGDHGHFAQCVGQADILVNATRMGMAPKTKGTAVPDPSVFREDLVVADVVYNPAQTRMMREAREAGVRTVIGGKGMLLWQGVSAFKLFTGQDMPVDEVKALYFAE